MKIKRIMGVILSIILTIAELIEYLSLPAVFVLLGILYQLPWQYYAITVGGFFILLAIGELAIYLVFKALNKKYASRFARKAAKIIARFSKDPENLPEEDN